MEDKKKMAYTFLWDNCSGVSIIDFTPPAPCHIRRERQHKTMKGGAAKGSYQDKEDMKNSLINLHEETLPNYT